MRTATTFILALLLTASFVQAQAPDADALFRAQDWDGAATAYAALTDAEPENGQAWYRLGLAQHSLERYAEAVAAWKEADRIGFAPARTHYNLASAYARLGQPDSAFTYLERVAQTGFVTPAQVEGDADLALLSDDPRFAEMLLAAGRASRPCQYDENYATFDFWVGAWDVFVQANQAGTNRIEKISEGCALLENWINSGGTRGHSLNYYDPQTGLWKQTWVGGTGAVTEYVEIDSGEGLMQFLATATQANGTEQQTRMTFTLNDDGSVRQLIETSNDGGATWTPGFDGRYVRQEDDVN